MSNIDLLAFFVYRFISKFTNFDMLGVISFFSQGVLRS